LLVLDANVSVSSLIPADINRLASRTWLSGALTGGDVLITPAIFLTEVAAALTRRTGDGSSGMAAMQQIQSDAAIQIFAVDMQLAQLAARLASTFALRGADSSYLALAVDTGNPLITWDRELISRAGAIARVVEPT
jgi:predicted nucleic acid-binding protein